MIQKLRMGMVGGGRDALIGGVHRMAARLDGEIKLVAGGLKTMPACFCGTRREPAGFSAPPKFLPAKKMTSACGCTAAKRRWNGTRKVRTN